MLIPNYMSTMRSGRSECSSLRPQVFRVHRPLIKAKRRCLVPTVSSLLIGIIEKNHPSEIFNYEIAEIHSMEAQIRTHEIPERPNVMDSLKATNSDCISFPDNKNIVCSCIKYHRTEDISVREDEDGIRSHLCPLDKSRDGARDENEDFPDESMGMDFADLLLKEYNLKSEDIPCLVGEKPPLSDSEDESKFNASSDVDASTSMIYALSQNQLLISEDEESLSFLLKHQMEQYPEMKLDEKIMASWNEETSDDDEHYSVNDRNSELFQKIHARFDESDMEEFDECVEDESNCFDRVKFSSVNENRSKNYKSLLEEEESLERRTENVKYGLNIGKSEFQHSLRVDTANEHHLQTYDTITEESELDNDSQSFDDLKEIDDVLKAVVEDAILSAAMKLQESEKDKKLDHPQTDFKTEEPVVEIESNSVAESHSLKNTGTIVKQTDGNLTESSGACKEGRDNTKSDKNVKNSNASVGTKSLSQDVLMKFHASHRNEPFRKEEEKDNLAMEPDVGRHSSNSPKNDETQPDLATALRFMTEVYHTGDEEDLYSDTLSTSDVPSKTPWRENSKIPIISKNCQDIQEKLPTDSLAGETSTCNSGPFEPVLVEAQRAVKRPRNKFSKFFQSFKRRLAKKE